MLSLPKQPQPEIDTKSTVKKQFKYKEEIITNKKKSYLVHRLTYKHPYFCPDTLYDLDRSLMI